MAKVLAEYTARITSLVQDKASKLETADYTAALDAALEDLNSNHPKVTSASEAGDGSTYEWTLASWVEEQSVVRSVEYPAGERNPEYLDADEYAMVIPGDLRLLNYTPGAAESIKISYTIPWTLTAEANDIPDRHFEAICSRAAAVCCTQLAAAYGQDTDPTYGGGVIQVGGKLPNYIKLSGEYIKVWEDHFDTSGGHEASFSIAKDFESKNSDGRGRMFH